MTQRGAKGAAHGQSSSNNLYSAFTRSHACPTARHPGVSPARLAAREGWRWPGGARRQLCATESGHRSHGCVDVIAFVVAGINTHAAITGEPLHTQRKCDSEPETLLQQ